jgi:formate dehydrogenase maturation protein FdhE
MSSEAAATCPFCGSPEVEMVAAWGGQLITQQMRCRACNTHFEALRDDFDGAGREDAETTWTSS